jgi:Tol biopolymer transport system component
MVEGSTGGTSDIWIVPISGDAPYQMGVTAFSDSVPDWQHTGTAYLVQNEAGVFEIFARDTTTFEDTRLTVGTSILGGPDASWTGEHMAFVQRTSATTTQTVVWQVADGTSVDIGSPESTSPAFYPNSDQLVVVDRGLLGLDIFVADSASGALIQQVTSTAASERSLAVSPRESSDIPFWLVP